MPSTGESEGFSSKTKQHILIDFHLVIVAVLIQKKNSFRVHFLSKVINTTNSCVKRHRTRSIVQFQNELVLKTYLLTHVTLTNCVKLKTYNGADSMMCM